MKLSYDLHTHILPGFDDGAASSEEALVLIDSLKKQGIDKICLTPHFYTHKESVEDFLERRDKAFEEFRPMIPDDVQVKLGAEVFVTRYLFTEERDLKPLCISGTSYMITEFSYDADFHGESMRMLTKLRDRGIIPVIPHIERYPKLLRDTDRLGELIYSGVIIQSNAVSYTDFLRRNKLLRLMKNGYIHILSSDAHSLQRNTPEAFSDALSIIRKKCGEDIVEELESNAADVFYGR